MINRYSLATSAEKLAKTIDELQPIGSYQRSFNISPLSKGSIITHNPEGFKHQMAIWGLLPHFTTELINVGNLFNVAAEGISSKSSYRIAIRQTRCLIPADSYYVKHKNDWYRVMRRDRQLFFMAGVYDTIALNPGEYRSYSMITTPSNRDLVDLQNPMPAIIDAELIYNWLEKDAVLTDVLSMLTVANCYEWIYYQITGAIEQTNYNLPDLHEELKSEKTLFDL